MQSSGLLSIRSPKQRSPRRIDTIKGEFQGKLLANRFLVGKEIDKGQCGKIHGCTDLHNKGKPLAIKISNQIELMKSEI